MITQRGTLKIMSNVAFPLSRNDRVLIKPVNNARTFREFWLEIPMIYIKTTLCTLTVGAAIVVGLMAPWLAKGLGF
jgi:hypothetical protein